MSSMFCCTFYIIEWGKVTNLSHKNKNLQTTIPIEIASLPAQFKFSVASPRGANQKMVQHDTG